MFDSLKKITVVKKEESKKIVRNQRSQCRINHKRKDC